MKTWNRERKRTRDRLLDYYIHEILPMPQTQIVNPVYPWYDQSLSRLSRQIYDIAVMNGFVDTEPNFWAKFSRGAVTSSVLSQFPVPGNENELYLDTETDVLYYFKQTENEINMQYADLNGVEIVGKSEDDTLTYLYIPVRALPIEDLIINSGTAAEYID